MAISISADQVLNGINLPVKIDGTWKEAEGAYTNINGAWKEVEVMFVKINGAWKEIG